MNTYYPMMMNLQGKKVIIVGGGRVATRKARVLLYAHAQVRIVSPQVTEELQEWVEEEKLSWSCKTFAPEDIQGAFIVIAATQYAEVNQQVYQAVNRLDPKPLVHLVDRPDQSDFILPSTLRRGKLMIAVTTSGASPSLARKITEELSQQYDDSYEEYVDFLHRCRLEILATIEEEAKRRRLFQELVNPSYLDLTRVGQLEERNRQFRELMEGLR